MWLLSVIKRHLLLFYRVQDFLKGGASLHPSPLFILTKKIMKILMNLILGNGKLVCYYALLMCACVLA